MKDAEGWKVAPLSIEYWYVPLPPDTDVTLIVPSLTPAHDAGVALVVLMTTDHGAATA